MELSSDVIAEIVQKQFDALPPKRKPQLRTDHVREWVPLSGIVVEGASFFYDLTAMKKHDADWV
jgi:tRNA-specific adenosine deaminase 1